MSQSPSLIEGGRQEYKILFIIFNTLDRITHGPPIGAVEVFLFLNISIYKIYKTLQEVKWVYCDGNVTVETKFGEIDLKFFLLGS